MLVALGWAGASLWRTLDRARGKQMTKTNTYRKCTVWGSTRVC